MNGFLNNVLAVCPDVFLVFGSQLIWIDWSSVFQNNMHFFNPRHMILKNVAGVVHRDRNDRASGLGCDLKSAFFKRKHGQLLAGISGAFRENADGNPLLDVINGF